MKYFFDNNLSPYVAEALRVLDQDVIHIADCAEHGITRRDVDVDWMPKVAGLGWCAVTIDNNIHRRREEKKVREACGLRVVYLYGAFGHKLKFFQQAVFIIRSWEAIVAATANARSGQCFRVSENHRVGPMT